MVELFEEPSLVVVSLGSARILLCGTLAKLTLFFNQSAVGFGIARRALLPSTKAPFAFDAAFSSASLPIPEEEERDEEESEEEDSEPRSSSSARDLLLSASC